MNTTEITIILPIFNLKSLRFNNFCFLAKKLNEIGCDVIVCEQRSDSTPMIEQYLVTFENLKHHVIDLKIDKINKSKLINHASKHSFTEFIWMVDADFYTDFNEVLNNADTDYDFIRPFSEVVFLSKQESYNLQATEQLHLDHGVDYKTNSQNGKFSFIIKSSEFARVGGMNEDFEGWGFQDLDFVENRLSDSVSYTSVSLMGYHMYHEPASTENVNINRQLYVNYTKAQVNDLVKKKLKEYTGKANATKKNIYLNKKLREVRTENNEPNKPIVKKRVLAKWKVPKFGIVYSSNKKVFFPGIDVITVRDTNSFKLKNINGRFTKVPEKKHFLYYYFEYICHIYELLEENTTVLFANDSYCKNSLQIKELVSTFNNVNSGEYINKEEIGYTSLHKEIQRTSLKESYSMTCCFLVNSNNILKRTYEHYNEVFQKMQNWTPEKFNEYLPVVKKNFID